MPKYLIEREVAGAENLSPEEIQSISQASCDVTRGLGPEIQWLHSYYTGDKVYCVYIAPDEALIEEHARQGGFPVDRISRITAVTDPATAETNAPA